MYVWCSLFDPTFTRPGIGGETSSNTPSDDIEWQRPAPLHASTVMKYVSPVANDEFHITSETQLSNKAKNS